LTFGFPAVVLLREADGQKVGFVHRGKMSEIANFVKAPRYVVVFPKKMTLKKNRKPEKADLFSLAA